MSFGRRPLRSLLLLSKRARWGLLLAVTLLGGCGSDDGGAEGQGPTCGADTVDERCAVFDIVNDERRAAGLSTYVWDQALALAAQQHADDMATQNYFDHTSLDGRSFSERASEAGYDASPRGENIAVGQQNATEVMQSWMNSSGHRNNIMSEGSTEIGVGLQGGYWVQVFGRRN
ncbi:MAG: CAP domain-containing protein [Myxococcota bacterium]